MPGAAPGESLWESRRESLDGAGTHLDGAAALVQAGAEGDGVLGWIQAGMFAGGGAQAQLSRAHQAPGAEEIAVHDHHELRLLALHLHGNLGSGMAVPLGIIPPKPGTGIAPARRRRSRRGRAEQRQEEADLGAHLGKSLELAAWEARSFTPGLYPGWNEPPLEFQGRVPPPVISGVRGLGANVPGGFLGIVYPARSRGAGNAGNCLGFRLITGNSKAPLFAGIPNSRDDPGTPGALFSPWMGIWGGGGGGEIHVLS